MATKSGTPFMDFDFSKFADFNTLGSQFKVPGVNPEAFVEMQRRNVEAFTAANRVAYEGAQAIAQRQVEILREAMTEAVKVTQTLTGVGDPKDRLVKQTELAKEGYEAACANFRELAEMNAKSGAEAVDLIANRVSESLAEVKTAFETVSAK